MNILLNIISNPIIAFMFVVGLVVFVHETGHFIAAKLTKIKVIEFSIGFGPQALSFQAFDTNFSLRILPLGGYVLLYGANLEENIPKENEHMSISHTNLSKRAIIAAAGPFANLLFTLCVITIFAYTGIPRTIPQIAVIQNSPAEIVGLKDGDIIKKINHNEIKEWQDIYENISKLKLKEVDITIERQKKEYNFILKPTYTEIEDEYGKRAVVARIGVSNNLRTPRLYVLDNSIFYKAGLKSGDLIKAINDYNIEHLSEFEEILLKHIKNKTNISITVERPEKISKTYVIYEIAKNEKKVNNIINVKLNNELFSNIIIENNNINKKMGFYSTDIVLISDNILAQKYQVDECKILHNEIIVNHENMDLTKGINIFWDWKRTTEDNLYKQNNKINKIKVNQSIIKSNAELINRNCYYNVEWKRNELNFIKPNIIVQKTTWTKGVPVKTTIIKSDNLGIAVIDGSKLSAKLIINNATRIISLIKGEIPVSNLGGPIQIARTAGSVAKEGFSELIILIALISMSIALVNLIPLPALDGGALLLVLIEAIYGKPLSTNVKLKIQQVGVIIIVLLFAVVFYNDILRMLNK